MRCCATGCASTSPASLSTRRCFETWGWRRPSRSTISPTARGFRRRRSTICRRFGSARALSVACTRHIYSCRNIPVKVYIQAASIEDKNRGDHAEDHDVLVVHRPGRRGDEVLRVRLQEREDPERRPDARRNHRTSGEGPEMVLADRGTGVHGAERGPAVHVPNDIRGGARHDGREKSVSPKHHGLRKIQNIIDAEDRDRGRLEAWPLEGGEVLGAWLDERCQSREHPEDRLPVAAAHGEVRHEPQQEW